jgi:predicted metalloprotease with PDZ domain
MAPLLGEAAHEFVHTWNLMRIRPAERTGIDYRLAKPTTGLWFSEGLTMYYADLLRRRARVPVQDSTRTLHLERLIARYLSNPGESRVSPERASLFEYGAAPGSLGDYDPSPHLQGELIGTMLDLVVRDASAGRRSMDDVMRTMLERHSGARGFTGADVERAVADACGCAVREFFDRYVRAPGAIPFDRYLALMGLKTNVRWLPATDRDGKPLTDLRIRAWLPPGEARLSILMYQPGGAWGRAGLHTGDIVTSVNGTSVATWPEFRSAIVRSAIGDTVRVGILRGAQNRVVSVAITGFDSPEVRIAELPGATPRQQALRRKWLAGTP